MKHKRYFKRIIALVLVLTMLAEPLTEIGHAAYVTIADSEVFKGESVENEINVIDTTVSSDGDTVEPITDTTSSEEQSEETGEIISEDEELIGEIITTDTGFRIQMNADKLSYSVIEYIGASANVVVPSSYEGLPITKILDAAFYGNTKAKTITIPDSIIFVGEYTFYGCTALKYNVADGGNYLGNEENPYYYFVGPVVNDEVTADSITEFTVHTDTVLVGSYAFAGFDNLKKVVMGDNLVHIGYAAMGKDSAIESLTIPFIGADGKGTSNYHLGYIFGARTTAGNISYVPLTLNELVVTGGNGGTKIVRNCLYGIDMVESLTLPFLGGYLGDEENGYLSYVFGGESYEDNVTPKALTYLHILHGDVYEGAFYNNVYLLEINIPDDSVHIYKNSFYGCTGLTYIHLPSTVKSIGEGAFLKCTQLTDVYITDIAKWCMIGFGDFYSNPIWNDANLFVNGSLLSDLIVPNSVTQISDYAFYCCSQLNSVQFPDEIIEIGDYAFYNCSNIIELNLPRELREVGAYAFANCSGLSELVMEGNIALLENQVFYQCTALESVYIDSIDAWCQIQFASLCSNPLYYASELYVNGELIDEIDIPEGISTISEYAFYGCDWIKSIKFSSTIKSIGFYAFYGCKGIEYVYIDNIEDWCEIEFKDKYSTPLLYGTLLIDGELVTEVVIPAYVTKVSPYAFYGCNSLINVYMHNGITEIGDYAFYYCEQLSNLQMSNSISTIGEEAFAYCENLSRVSFGDNLSEIGSGAFYGCTKLERVDIVDIGVWCETIFGNLYANPIYYTSTLYINDEEITELCIPSGVEYISDYAFYNSASITSVQMNDELMNIGVGAFQNCTSLTTVLFSDKIETIGASAFRDTNIYSLNLPKNLKEIGTYAFYRCNFDEIYIYENVTSIGQNAFHDMRYSWLSGQCVYIFDINAWCEISFGNAAANPMYGANSVYLNDILLTNIEIDEGVKVINNYAFYCFSFLETITLPTSIDIIGKSAFYGCSNLTKAVYLGSQENWDTNVYVSSNNSELTDNLIYENIEDSTSDETEEKDEISSEGTESVGLEYISNGDGTCYVSGRGTCLDTELIIPKIAPNGEQVIGIGERAFYSCYDITSVILPEGLVSIGDYAFYGCYRNTISITSLEAVNDISLDIIIKSYEDDKTALYLVSSTSLSAVSGLSSIVLPDTIKEIGEYAFYGCELIETIDFPQQLERIGEKAFYSTGLSSITFSENLNYVGSYAFKSLQRVNVSSLENWCNIEFEDYTATPGYYSKNVLIGETYLTEFVELTFGQEIKIINDFSFYGFSNLESVYIPNHVLEIGSSPFAGCEMLGTIIYEGDRSEWRHLHKSTDWENGIEGIIQYQYEQTGELYDANEQISEFWVSGYSELLDESGTGEVIVRERYSGRTVTKVYEKAFDNSNLVSIELPDCITQIGQYAFRNCMKLEKISLPHSLISVQKGVLEGCISIKELELPYLGYTIEEGTDEYLGYYFGANSYKENSTYVPQSLRNVTVLDGKTIADYCFYGCNYIENVDLPLSIVSIGDYAFEDCMSLISFEIPDSVTSIGKMIFNNCNNLQEITIGELLTNIPEYQTGDSLFGINKSRSMLEKYIVSPDNQTFATDSHGILYRKLTIDSEDKLVAVMDAPAMANLKGYTIPDLIVEIAPYAFAYNESLTAVDLGYVRMIGNNAFFEADSLIYVALNPVPTEDTDEALLEALESVEYNQYIGREAFMGCDNLMRIDIDSDNIIGIDDYAFADCPKMTKINLGDKVQKLGLSAFGATTSGDSNIEWISVDGANTHFKGIDGVLYSVNEDGSLILELYPARLITYDAQGNKVYRTDFELPAGQKISAIQSYAFRGAKDLDKLVVDTDSQLIVGDYAFSGSQIQTIEIGENVTSLGLLRGESEYTVFSDMEYLTDITVDENNPYYSSESGVLFDKNQRKLIKYPSAKTGSEYTVPDTVVNIASMAFKSNSNLDYVTITSDVSTIGLEAFYACSELDQITFKDAYAPMSIMENAFTTKLEIEGEVVEDPRTLIGYFEDYYADGENGEYGWNHYDGVYSLVECKSVPELVVTEDNSNFYSVVVIDSNGTRLGNVQITMTDPNGVSETVISGGTNGSTGIAMFYDLYDKVGMGFDIDFERPYSITVSDPYGDFYTYTNPSIYLDEDTLVTYITLSTMPTAYGLNCNNEDINSQRVELNKSQIEFTDLLLDENGDIQYAADGVTPLFKEVVEISAIGYCDTESGYAFVDADGNVLDASCGLYQNGVKVADVARTEVIDGATIFYFEPKVADLANEVDIELRLVAVHDTNEALACNTILNIHIFDFALSKEDINFETDDFEIDLSQAGELFKTLFGKDALEVSVGKNTKLSMDLEGDLITILLKYSKKNSASYSDYKEGYETKKDEGREYLFSYDYPFVDEDGKAHILNYNIRFTRATEDEDYYYYCCMLYDGRIGTKENRLTTFYGIVNKPNLPTSLSDRLDAKNKADLIFGMHYAYVLSECDSISDIKKSGGQAYCESLIKKPQTTSEQNFSFGLSGEIQIKYEGNGKFTPVESTIKGEVTYTFKYNQQMVVWTIPVILSVEVNAEGKIELKLDFDEDRKITFNELEATLKLEANASAGVGAKYASVGIYGNVGTVLVIDILPEFEIESWKVYGEMGAYVKILWKEKKIRFTPDSWKDGYYIIPNGDSAEATMVLTEANYMAAMYLVDLYENVTPEALAQDYRLVVIDGELYKLCYADVSELTNYDEYNYVKLALSKWTGTEWTESTLIDDNGLNDAAYTLYQDGDKTMLIYTQQTQTATMESMSDTYVSAQNLAIKVVELKADMSEPEYVFTRDNYAYLTQYTVVDGVPTIVWAENADNNMFGVSPYNYIDSNGVSHVFATSANSVWMTQFIDGEWTEAVCLMDGLSTITQLVVNESGYVAYIVDTNGDLSDTEDRVLSYGKLGADFSALNDTEQGSILSVLADDSGFLYYYDVTSENEVKTDGWYTVSTEVGGTIQNLPSYVPTDFVPVYDADGIITAVLYKKNKTWVENETSVTGAAIYGIFYEDGDWGLPVEIDSYVAQANTYVTHFSAVLYDGEIALHIATTDSVGENTAYYDCRYSCEARIVISDYNVNYTEGTVTFTLQNIGAQSTAIYMSLNGNAFAIITSKPLASGESMEYVVELTANMGETHSVIFASDGEGSDAVSIDNISMEYSDVLPVVKQLLMGENDVMLLAIKNTGNLTNTAITIVRVGSRPVDELLSEEILDMIYSLELVDGEVQLIEFTNEDGETEFFWVVKDTIEAGKIVYHELTLNEHPQMESGVLIGAYTVAVNDTEYGTAADNNYAYLYYENCEGVLAENESVATAPSVDKNTIVYDSEADEDITFDIAYGTDDSISDIQVNGVTVATDDYSIEALVVGARITLGKAYLDTLGAGNHSVVVVFDSGETCEVQLSVSEYYTITWIDGNETIEMTVLEGTLPTYGETPTKESDTMYDYYFVGWDSDGDGTADAIVVADSDATYTAIWGTELRKYTVTWIMEDEEGNLYQIEELYEYGTTPEYEGNIFLPEGKIFKGWDTTVSMVTGDVTYTANYGYEFGDINGDNKRDIKDIIMLRQYILGLRELTEDQIKQCNVYEDYNSDGSAKINAKDIALLKQYILGIAS